MMDKEYKTPQKILSHQSPIVKFFEKNTSKIGNNQNVTPRQIKCIFNSPVAHCIKNSTYNIFPVNVIHTPPTKKVDKVTNPFEKELTERLHLPLICSPSLFHRPKTPQQSCTQFEWTIEEVSSLGPANLEPYETQFHESIDPELEAKAQAAITSYFKEQTIVPSPLGSGRSQQLVLAELICNTPISKPDRRIRDGITQTVLTFPPILPPHIESLLKPYFSYNENQQQQLIVNDILDNTCDKPTNFTDFDARDASLRRKLFDYQNHDEDTFDDSRVIESDSLSPPPISSPDLNVTAITSAISDNSFGSLSPISKDEIPSKQSIKLNVSRSNYEEYSGDEMLKVNGFQNHRSSSPTSDDISMDNCFSGKAKCNFKRLVDESDVFAGFQDDKCMQVSQVSMQSMNSSNCSFQSDTPRSRKRWANRKNLSQSFSLIHPDAVEENTVPINNFPIVNISKVRTVSATEIDQSIFYRTDSGFNETTTKDAPQSTSGYDNNVNVRPHIHSEDTSMISSTPSKQRS